jgi:transcription initiation factor TFIIH subunit 3
MSESEQSSLLCILLDIVSLLQQEESIEKIYGALLLFCNSYLLMHRKNRVIILLTTSDDVKIIYPPTSSNSTLSSTYHELSVTVASQIVAISKEEKQKMTNVKHPSNSTGNYLANGLSKSLCIINRQIQLSKFLPRVLIMQFDKDRVVDYNSFMNSIFNAQKLEILVDALVVSKFDSHILQQACFLTGGLYLRHRDEDNILQILTMHFLLDDKVRKLFNQPLQKTVDFKASCHCHRSPVEYAYMCSVCLTLICEDADVCPVCSSPSRRVAANRAPFKINAFKT